MNKVIRSNPFPLKQSELNEYFKNAITHLQNNAARFGLSNLQVSNLASQLEEWKAAYVMYRTSLNKNKAVYTLSLTMDALQSELKKIYTTLDSEALTDLDRDILNLRNFWVNQELLKAL